MSMQLCARVQHPETGAERKTVLTVAMLASNVIIPLKRALRSSIRFRLIALALKISVEEYSSVVRRWTSDGDMQTQVHAAV